jgi:uncharacterized protein
VILVDAGPLVAIVDAEDQYHDACSSALRRVREPLATLWPNVTEAMYHLLDVPQAQQSLLEMLRRGTIRLLPLESGDLPRICDLIRKYSDRPMDLADAALVRVAEREGIRTIFTLDRRDFSVYRLHGRIRPELIP